MNSGYQNGIRAWQAAIAVACLAWVGNGLAQSATLPNVTTATTAIRLVELQGAVEILSAGATVWVKAQTNQVLHPFDKVHTAENSRVALRWSDQSIVPFGASTELEILPPDAPDAQAGLHLTRGIISFFHRDQPGRIRVITHGAVAGVEGTEFVLAVDDAERTTLSVVDGKVKLSNAQAALVLTNGEQAVVELGHAPVRTAGFIANNLLQWCFYYPAVIDPDELQFTAEEKNNLAGSLAAYRAGDLPAALEKYPAGRQNISDRERVYAAALLLSVGEVEKAQAALSALADKTGRPEQLGNSLRQLIAAVKRQPPPATGKPKLASEFLAGSYFEQSLAVRETSLENALRLAKKAASIAPKFGFAWERVAELEFSFGRMKSALADLNRSLELAPVNAQALALKGFILAAQNQPLTARGWFDRAIAADSALGNAWLGRGLVRIRSGDKAGGREDLLVAAALEPQRAELRNYLGKSYVLAGDDRHASKELALAKKLDPNDPTAWFYSALHNQQNNQINDAIRDLEKSKSLNDNRSVYRSQLLLDQDRAVRSANLAGIYRDAGMTDVSLREAQKAVSYDYANYSSHLFLANSYEQLRDPNWSNLRYETPANAEYWMANLLAPPSAGTLSSIVSEQPAAKLFDQNRVGVVSDTTYLSRGAWMQAGAQFGTINNFSYDVESKYIYDPGQRPNSQNEHRDLSLTIKGQLTPQDSVLFSVEQDRINTGDTSEYYSKFMASTNVLYQENQDPNLFLGFHHEWSPGIHTLFMVSQGKSTDVQTATRAGHLVGWYYNKAFTALRNLTDNNLVTISENEDAVELQQIFEQACHTTVVGARYAWGDLHFQNLEWKPFSSIGGVFIGVLGSYNPDPKHPFEIANQDITDTFHHLTAYGYHDWQLLDSLKLSAGVAYDDLYQPSVVNTAPFNHRQKTTGQVSPKAGVMWTPLEDTTLRFAYTRSLAGFVSDGATRLEPTQMAGFNQAYRSLIPTSVIGDSSGATLDTYDISLEQKFDTGTYVGVSGEMLYSQHDELQGAYIFDASSPLDYPIYPNGMKRTLDYREKSVAFTVDQLLGRQWSIGARYRLSQAKLDLSYPLVKPNLPVYELDAPFRPCQNPDSVLQTVSLHANWNHPSGLFSSLEGNWYRQSNSGFTPAEPGDNFWQLNAYAGWRFWHRKAEISVGLLNVTDQNYRLEPLNFYNEMARSRTFITRLLVSF